MSEKIMLQELTSKQFKQLLSDMNGGYGSVQEAAFNKMNLLVIQDKLTLEQNEIRLETAGKTLFKHLIKPNKAPLYNLALISKANAGCEKFFFAEALDNLNHYRPKGREMVKEKYLIEAVKSIKDFVTDIGMTSYKNEHIHLSEKIGSDKKQALIMIPETGVEDAVSAIRCQKRKVFGEEGMQQRVIQTYGNARNDSFQLIYFKQYAEFLNIDPAKNQFVNAPAYKFI